MMYDIERSFMCLLAIYTSSLLRCLFKSLTNFLFILFFNVELFVYFAQVLSQMCLLQIFPPIFCLLILLIVFHSAEVFNFSSS